MSNSINLKEFIERISYNKSQTYTKEEVLQELAKIQLLSIVDTLPTENIPSNKIFLVLNDEEIEGNKYDLFVYVNNKWEQIDSLEFNIEDYPTKNELDYELSLKADINHGHDNVTTSSDGFMSKEDKSKLNGIENQATRNLPSDDNPLMDGTASSGTGKDYSRKDHVHPTDTSRASSTHVHGNISNDGKIGSTANKPLITTTSGSVTTGNFETSTNNIKMDGTVNVGSSNNFARSDHVHPTDTSRASTDTATSSKNGLMSKEDKSKLDGVEDEANNYTHPSYTAKTNGLYKVTVDNTGHISGTNTVSGSDLPSHNHDTGDMKDTSAYGNIGSSANATQKTINNNINTKLGQKANSSDVYTKSQTMTSTEIGQAIADGVSNVEIFEVVTTLPTSNIKGNKFYLVPNGENIDGNVYDVNIYVNNKWETIDKLEFDISNYPTTTQVNSLLEGKVDKTDSRLTDSRTPKSHTHGNITNTGAIGSTSGKIVTTGTNGVLTTSDTITKSQISDFPSTMTPSSHTHGAVQNNGTLNSDTTSTNKVVVTDSSNNIKTISKLPLDKVTHQDISGKASSTHTHGSIANNGTLNSDTTTVGKVVVTDGSNNIKTISKLPSANVTHQDISGKAPNNHKSTATTYGVGDASNYGHVKVDSSMNATSTNPVQNKVVKDYIDEQVGDIVSGDVDLSNTHNHDDRYVGKTDSRLTDARTPKFNLITASESNIVDLDTYKTGGFYYTNSDANYAKYIIHCPWSNGTTTPYTGNKSFFLLVETWGTTSNYVKQTLTYYTNNTTFTRTCSNGTWSTWGELSKNGHNHNSLPYVNTVLAGEALTSGKLIGAKSDGKYYNLASELELDTTYPIYKVFNNVGSGSASNAVDFFNQGYPISSTKSVTLTGGKPVYIEGRSYSQGKFRVSGNIVTQTLTEGYFYINIGTAYDTANVRLWLADNTVHYYDGEKLVPCTENNYNTGGTNLIPNSQEFITTTGLLTGETYKGCNIRRVNNTSGTTYVDYTWSNLPKIGEFKQGDVFTLSFWAKGTGQLVAYNYGNSGYMTSRPIRTNGTPSATYGDGNCYFTLTDEWKRYYVTWVLNPSMSDTALTVNKVLLLRTMKGADSYVCGVMYERGDTAHDWSPSPSDNVAEYIVGTQTASTSAWTGKSKKIYALTEGTVIYYKLPYASTSTAVTLNLTLADGTTTGAKEVWFWNGGRLTTHYGVNSVVGLIYNGSQWWVINPSSNNSDGSLLWGGVRAKTGNASITANTLIGAKNDGLYYKLASGMVLDIRYPIVYLTVATNANTITTNIYHVHWNAYTSNNGFSTWTVPNMIYLEGTAYSKGQFTISSTIMTQTLVSGRYYIPLGEAESASQIKLKNLGMNVYYYDGTNFIPVSSWDGIKDKPSTFTPSSHTHGNITNDGKIGSTANKPLITTSNGTITTGDFGSSTTTTANYFVACNDQRLSDTRNPKITVVANGTDLNTLRTAGFYYQNSDNNATNMVNMPNNIKKAFTLLVESFGNNTFTKQTLTFWDYDFGGAVSSQTYIRTSHYTNNVWTKWQMIKNNDPIHLLSHNVGDAGYFKFLSLNTTGNYHDQTISFDITHRSKPQTRIQLTFGTYQKDGDTTNYWTKITNFWYDGYPTPVYYVQTKDEKANATFDFYIRRDTWDTMAVTDVSTSEDNRSGLTITRYKNFVTSLPTGTVQATLNPYYAQVGHTHGSIANNGQLNSDITSVNKVAVTDSSNNLKTISQLPYSKISGTPTITNNLTTSTTGTVLDASQGKWLKDNTVQTAGTGLTKSSNTLGITNGGVGATQLASNAVEEGKIKDGAVTTNKLGANAVTSAKIADSTIVNGDIANTTITGGKLVNGTITATQLADKSVTDAKLANYEYINGTQTASTSAWTGVTTKLTSTTIPTGTIIYYRLNQSSTSTNATLELKLSSDNTKTTGAKAVYLDDRRVTTHFRLGSIIPLRYDGTNWIVISPYTDTNTTYSTATASANGLMSSTDKSKLDNITASADAVSYSQTTSSSSNTYEIGKITINGTSTTLYGQDTVYVAPNSYNTSYVKEPSALGKLGTSANATQATVNSAINTKIGNLIDSTSTTKNGHTHGSIANNGTLDSDITSANMNKIVVTDGSKNIKTAICEYKDGKLKFGSG